MPQIYIILISVALLAFIFSRRYYLVKKAVKRKILQKKEQIQKEVEKTKQEELNMKSEAKTQQPRLQRSSINSINYLLKRAEMFMAKKEYGESEKLYIQILVMDQENLLGNKQLALLYLLTKRDRKAEAIYKKLAEKDLKDPSIFTNLGLALYNQSKYDEAIKAYQESIHLDPHRAARYINLGQVYFLTRNFEHAIQVFQKAVDLEPHNIQYILMLADTYRETEDYKKAKQFYNKVLSLDPYNEEIKKELTAIEALSTK